MRTMKQMAAVMGLLVLVALGAIGQETIPAYLGPRAKVARGGWTDFTNKAQQASAGDWIILPPGPLIHIPTNAVSLLKPGVNFYIYPPLFIGTTEDTTARPIFGETAATTNTLILRSGVVSSNRAQIVAFTNAATRIWLQSPLMYRAATSLTHAVMQQGGGNFDWDVGELRNDGYDGYWCSSQTGVFTNIGRCGRMIVADTALEYDSIVGQGYDEMRVGSIRRVNFAYNKPTSSLLIQAYGGNQTWWIGDIDYNTNGYALFGQSGGSGVYGQYHIGRQDFSAIAGPLDEAPCTITGPSRFYDTEWRLGARAPAFDLLTLAANELILHNNRIVVPATTTATYAMISSLAQSMRAIGGLEIVGTNKPIDLNLHVNGTTTGVIFTNSYAGTNVFVNLSGHSHQALIVTNAMLIVPTNSASFEGRKEITLTMFHNGSGGTNDNAVVAIAGTRILSGGQLVAGTAPMTFTVTNTRTAKLIITKHGTNNFMTLEQQQN